jgi:hypothetical protein
LFEHNAGSGRGLHSAGRGKLALGLSAMDLVMGWNQHYGKSGVQRVGLHIRGRRSDMVYRLCVGEADP